MDENTPMIFTSLKDVAIYFSVDETLPEAEVKSLIEKNVYKFTDCGAWIKFMDNGIELGSIVEGSDAEVSSDPLIYPFPEIDIEETIDYIEREASWLWTEANESEDDYEAES